MKKLMIATALAAFCGAVQAGISSSNTVGYNQKTLTAGNQNAVSIPFTVAGSDIASIYDCIDVANATAAATDTDADQIWVWDPVTSGYNFYYLYDGDGIWYNVITWATWDQDFPSGIEPGFSFWYSAKANANVVTMTQSGQVPDFATIPVAIRRGNQNAISYPYPVAFNADPDNEHIYAQVDWGNATAAATDTDADQIWVWDPVTSGYNFYYLYDGDGIWYNVITWATFTQDFPSGLPAGTMFWYSAKSGGTQTITFKSPL